MEIPYRTTILTDDMKARALEVLEVGLPSYEGPHTQQFEVALAALCGTSFGVSANSGTSALTLALAAHDVGPGDEVVLGANDYVGCVSAIVRSGARPVFVDSEPATANLRADLVEGALTERTRAIFASHLYGHPCDMDPLVALAAERDLLLIEDFAHALGARYKGSPVGGVGDVGFCSFSGKHITVFGPGGIAVTGREALAEAMSSLRDQGRTRAKEKSYVRRRDGAWYDTERIGFNMHLSELSAALGCLQLQHLPDWNRRRRAIASHYDERFAGLPLRLPREASYATHAYLHYSVQTPQRDELRDHLRSRGVESQIHYPWPLPRLRPIIERFGSSEGRYPEADRIASEILSLPVGPHLTDEAVEYIVECVGDFFSG